MFLVKRMEDFDFKPTNNSLLSLLGRTSIEVETSAVGYLPVYGCLDDLRKDYPDVDYEEIRLRDTKE